MAPHGGLYRHRSHVTKARPLDFLYDPVNVTSSYHSHVRNVVKARTDPSQLHYVAVYPYMFSGLPQFFPRGHYEVSDARYPHHMDLGYPKAKPDGVPELGSQVRGPDRWQSYQRPNIPHFTGNIEYLDYQFPPVRVGSPGRKPSQESASNGLLETSTQNVACQTDYRVQSVQTDPAELGTQMREAYQYFDTIYPKHYKPFTNKTMSLIKRGLKRKELRDLVQGGNQTQTPEEQMQQYERLENEKWEYLGREMQEHMEDRLAVFKECIEQSQQYLKERIQAAQDSLEQDQQKRFNSEMDVLWHDVNIWRRFCTWKKDVTERKIAQWQTNPADVQLMKQVSEVFSHDARRYFPRVNQGDIVPGLTWDNKPDYFLDTWEGFSQVLKEMSPSDIRADIYLPKKKNMYGPKGYVKRDFKETARFGKIAFSFANVDYGDSNLDLTQLKPKRTAPALLQPKPIPKKPRPILTVPPMDTDGIETYQAAVVVQKLVKGRAMQKMIQTGIRLRKDLIDEVRGNVALTDRAKIEMKQKYEEMQEHGRVLLFHRYRVRFIDSFLSTLEARTGTRVLRERHFALVRHLEIESITRWKMYAEAQRRMREAHEAGRRQQDYRRYAEKEQSVQLFHQSHHVPAERAVNHAVKIAESHMARSAFLKNQKDVWRNISEANSLMTTAMNTQEKETFVASMVYSVMIPDVQRQLVREQQNLAMESRRLAIHETLFGAIAGLSRKIRVQNIADPPDGEQRKKRPKFVPRYPKILPVLRKPKHRLDMYSSDYKIYVKRRKGMMRCMDFEYNFAASAQLIHPASDYFTHKASHETEIEQVQIGLQQLQKTVDRVLEKRSRTTYKPPQRLRPRRVRFVHRFDRIDRLRMVQIAQDPKVNLSENQLADVEEIFAEERVVESEETRAEYSKGRRKEARERAGVLWGQAQGWLKEQVSIYQENQVRAYGLPSLRETQPAPAAQTKGNKVSAYDIRDVANMGGISLTVHTTGEPENAVDDVIILNEIQEQEFVPRRVPDEEYIRTRMVQAKLNY